METAVRCVVQSADTLGEGPTWCAESETLYWLDIEGRHLHAYSPAEGGRRDWQLPARASVVVPRAQGQLLLATENGLQYFDPASGAVQPWLDLEPDLPHNRTNDGKCDRSGRLWVGTMDDRHQGRRGSLYRIDQAGRVDRLFQNLGIPNTLAWSPDNRRCYFGDSVDEMIYAYDFDPAGGDIGNRRVFVDARGHRGVPDGSTIDREGYLWNAEWDGWRLVRYAPSGAIDREISVPVQRPTSCIFGGEGLRTLFITSARQGLSDADLASQPLAGGLFAVDLDVGGIAEVPFAG